MSDATHPARGLPPRGTPAEQLAAAPPHRDGEAMGAALVDAEQRRVDAERLTGGLADERALAAVAGAATAPDRETFDHDPTAPLHDLLAAGGKVTLYTEAGVTYAAAEVITSEGPAARRHGFREAVDDLIRLGRIVNRVCRATLRAVTEVEVVVTPPGLTDDEMGGRPALGLPVIEGSDAEIAAGTVDPVLP